jgi:hypothetical protein
MKPKLDWFYDLVAVLMIVVGTAIWVSEIETYKAYLMPAFMAWQAAVIGWCVLLKDLTVEKALFFCFNGIRQFATCFDAQMYWIVLWNTGSCRYIDFPYQTIEEARLAQKRLNPPPTWIAVIATATGRADLIKKLEAGRLY